MEAETVTSNCNLEPAILGVCDSVYGVTYGNSIYLAVGENGTILTSADGHEWAHQNSTVETDLYSACWSPQKSIFVVSGDHGTILTSPDGLNWTKQSSGADRLSLSAIVWLQEIKLFVAVSGTNWLLVSPDAAKWTLQNVGSRNIRGVHWIDHLGLLLYE